MPSVSLIISLEDFWVSFECFNAVVMRFRLLCIWPLLPETVSWWGYYWAQGRRQTSPTAKDRTASTCQCNISTLIASNVSSPTVQNLSRTSWTTKVPFTHTNTHCFRPCLQVLLSPIISSSFNNSLCCVSVVSLLLLLWWSFRVCVLLHFHFWSPLLLHFVSFALFQFHLLKPSDLFYVSLLSFLHSFSCICRVFPSSWLLSHVPCLHNDHWLRNNDCLNWFMDG